MESHITAKQGGGNDLHGEAAALCGDDTQGLSYYEHSNETATAMKARISPAMELRYQEQLRQSNGRADTQRHSGPEQRQSAASNRNIRQGAD